MLSAPIFAVGAMAGVYMLALYLAEARTARRQARSAAPPPSKGAAGVGVYEPPIFLVVSLPLSQRAGAPHACEACVRAARTRTPAAADV